MRDVAPHTTAGRRQGRSSRMMPAVRLMVAEVQRLGRASPVSEPLCGPEPRPRRPAHDTTGRHQSTPARGISPDLTAYNDIRRGQPTPADTRVSDLLIRGWALGPVGARWRGALAGLLLSRGLVMRVDGVRHGGRRVLRRTP
ncbi:MAG: hypothetical protein QOH74_1948 [Gaiellales bacterium]|jgi:hypothetical protein|nr:hypothetical protein [Gaiellales bacterium]